MRTTSKKTTAKKKTAVKKTTEGYVVCVHLTDNPDTPLYLDDGAGQELYDDVGDARWHDTLAQARFVLTDLLEDPSDLLENAPDRFSGASRPSGTGIARAYVLSVEEAEAAAFVPPVPGEVYVSTDVFVPTLFDNVLVINYVNDDTKVIRASDGLGNSSCFGYAEFKKLIARGDGWKKIYGRDV